jgi:hypothetical protein
MIVEKLLDSIMKLPQTLSHKCPIALVDAPATSPVSGDTLDGPEEDKKMKACSLASTHIVNEAEENDRQDTTRENCRGHGDGPVDIGKEVLDDIESAMSTTQAEDPTLNMSNNVHATAAGDPPENEEEDDSPHSPSRGLFLKIIDLTESDEEPEGENDRESESEAAPQP